MRTRLCNTFLAILTLSSTIAFGGSSNATSQLTGDYQKISHDFETEHIAAIGKLMTSDFASVQSDGTKISKQEILKDLQSQRALLSKVTWQRTISSISIVDADAVVTVSGHMLGTRTDVNGGDHTFEFVATSKDTWTKTSHGWKLRLSEPLSEKMSVDGTPLENIPKRK